MTWPGTRLTGCTSRCTLDRYFASTFLVRSTMSELKIEVGLFLAMFEVELRMTGMGVRVDLT